MRLHTQKLRAKKEHGYNCWRAKCSEAWAMFSTSSGIPPGSAKSPLSLLSSCFSCTPPPVSPFPSVLGPSPVSDPRLTLAYRVFHQASHTYQQDGPSTPQASPGSGCCSTPHKVLQNWWPWLAGAQQVSLSPLGSHSHWEFLKLHHAGNLGAKAGSG